MEMSILGPVPEELSTPCTRMSPSPLCCAPTGGPVAVGGGVGDRWQGLETDARGQLQAGGAGSDDELNRMWILRKLLHSMEDIDATEFLVDKLKDTKTNDEFFASMKRK